MPGIYTSGQKAASAVIIDEKFFYTGCILRTSGATECTLQIHNCAAIADVTADNMVGEVSVVGEAGACSSDSPGSIECPLGIVAILVGATGLYHVRGSATL